VRSAYYVYLKEILRAEYLLFAFKQKNIFPPLLFVYCLLLALYGVCKFIYTEERHEVKTFL